MNQLVKSFVIHEIREVSKAGAIVHQIDGVCTVEEVDLDNEICDYKDTKPLYEAWSSKMAAQTEAAGQEISYGNVRIQHTLEVGGKVTKMWFEDDRKEIWVTIEPKTSEIFRQVKKGFYTGFSQAGRAVYRKCNECGTDCGEPGNNICPRCLGDVIVRYACDPGEISIVDVPCAQSAIIRHVKASGAVEILKFSKPGKEGVRKEARTKRVAGEDLPPSAFAYVGDPERTETWHYPIKFGSDNKTKTHVRNALSQWRKPKGQASIPEAQRAGVYARIVAAARRHGINVSRKVHTMEIKKSLYHIGWIADIMSSIRSLRDAERCEGVYEDDDRDLAIADELQGLLEAMVGVGRAIYDEETDELTAIVQKAAKGDVKAMDNVLLKAARKSLQHHFTKAAASHTNKAEHHKDLHEEHLAAAETMKGAMDDPECKAMHPTFKAMHGHHKAMAAAHLKLHKAHTADSVHNAAMAEANTEKAAPEPEVVKAAPVAVVEPVVKVAAPAAVVEPAAAVTPGTNDVQKAADTAFQKMFEGSLERIMGSADVQKSIDATISKMLLGRIGNEAIPTTVKTAGLSLVTKAAGEQDVQKAAPQVISTEGVPLDLMEFAGIGLEA